MTSVKRKHRRLLLVGIYIFLATYFVFSLFPFYWIFVTSIKTEKDVISYIPKFIRFKVSLRNYADLFQLSPSQKGTGEFRGKIPFLRYLFNSVKVVPAAVGLSLLLGIPAAYALARYKFVGKESLAFFYLSQYFLPPILVLVPLYIIYQKLGLYNTYLGFILILQLVNLPLTILVMRGFFADLPVEIEESAFIDGCNFWQMLSRISIPLAAPGIVATAFLTAVFSWNNFLFGLVLMGTKKMPVTVGMLSFQTYVKVQWNLMAGAALVAALPPLILALFFQRYLVRGLTLGAIK